MSLIYTLQWPKGGIITQRGKNTYYSHFFTVTDHVLSKQYATGSIISIIINKKTLLAEITHLWLYDGTTGYARLKLYSLPEDLPHGRTHHHGEVSFYFICGMCVCVNLICGLIWLPINVGCIYVPVFIYNPSNKITQISKSISRTGIKIMIHFCT